MQGAQVANQDDDFRGQGSHYRYVPAKKPRHTQFGAALTAHREGRGWTLEYVAGRLNDLADTTTHTKGTVGRWERGEHGEPSPKNKRLLAEVFGITVNELQEPPKRPKPVSIDEMLEGRPPDVWIRAAQMVELLIGSDAPPRRKPE